MSKYKNALIISDTQIPFHHPDMVRFLRAIAAEIKPHEVYHVGDEFDANTFSRFTRDPDLPAARDEWRLAAKTARQLHEMFPQMRLCNSNHGSRIYKRLQIAGLPEQFLRPLQEIYSVPGWQWAPGWSIETAYGPARITHGVKKKGAINRARQTGGSRIQGHYHSLFGLEYYDAGEGVRFGMDVGSLVDMSSRAFMYAEEGQYTSMLGCGAIVDGYPRLFPMIVNSKNRWIGKLV